MPLLLDHPDKKERALRDIFCYRTHGGIALCIPMGIGVRSRRVRASLQHSRVPLDRVARGHAVGVHPHRVFRFMIRPQVPPRHARVACGRAE